MNFGHNGKEHLLKLCGLEYYGFQFSRFKSEYDLKWLEFKLFKYINLTFFKTIANLNISCIKFSYFWRQLENVRGRHNSPIIIKIIDFIVCYIQAILSK